MSETRKFLQSDSRSSNPVYSQHERLLHSVSLVEEILFLRWQAIETVEGHNEERDAMQLIANNLLSIKVHKLGWPDSFMGERRDKHPSSDDSC
jgi:hypothetical protein